MPDLYLAARMQGGGMPIHIRVRPLGKAPGPVSLERTTVQTTGLIWLDEFSSYYLDSFESFWLDEFSSFYLDDFSS